MNPARLAELNHQHALVREQLAWLEREIAKESAGLVPTVAVIAPPVAPRPGEVAHESEAYRPDPVSAANDTRRGCLIAVVIAALVMMGSLTAIYVLRYSDRPLLFVAGEDDSPTSAAPTASPSPTQKK